MTTGDDELARMKRWFLRALVAGLAVLVLAVNISVNRLQNGVTPERPFGVFQTPGGLLVQDFSYNLLYFRGIRDRVAPRPYTLPDQEKIARHYVPNGGTGLSHAYSPVAYVLVQPLLVLPGKYAYLLYTVFAAIGIALLFRFCLLPSVTDRRQLYALALCLTGLPLLTGFEVGQSTLITTTLLGFFWMVLCASEGWKTESSAPRDVLLATLFWALCLKPPVALIPLALLLGAKAWRPLLLGALLLALTWLAVASHYGGQWIGLHDYATLLSHYTNDQLTPFMQRGAPAPAGQAFSVWLFAAKRVGYVSVLVLLVLLRWLRRLDACAHFQGTVWSFLLLSPYLLSLENWALCLLVVEGTFFASSPRLASLLKLVLLFCLFDLRQGINFSYDLSDLLKWTLMLWLVFAAWRAGPKNSEAPS